jgi:hypothetical protein
MVSMIDRSELYRSYSGSKIFISVPAEKKLVISLVEEARAVGM